ncbi:MAG: site-specific DNA-methyltransferase [Planctomycetaceae bacterium]|jgi:adenine-specific DNA-methyltransferase|nr:site-specific DNA-methyltransferase [Planctomycetaceae bacterium]
MTHKKSSNRKLLRGGLKSALVHNKSTQPNSELLQTLKFAVPQFFEKDVYDENGNLVKAGDFKVDKFLDELKSNDITESYDGYKLGFIGKNYARLQTGRLPETMIVPDIKHNSQNENKNSKNIFITGDNLEVLRHLQNAYAGKIKLIYIDPPYNTGKEFIYNDKFEFDDEKLKTALGYDKNEITRLKSLQGKSSHSAWLMFMYPRLKFAQKLLNDDGVIFVSIDDNELANLRLLMDDIFGEGNFVSNSVVITNRSGRDYGGIAQTHDYLVIYTKNFGTELNMVEEQGKEYDFYDEKGGFNLMELRNRNVIFNDKNRPNLCYPFFVNPNSNDENNLLEISLEPKKDFVEVMPLKSQGIQTVWRWGKEKSSEHLNKEIKGKSKQDGNFMIVQKSRINAKRQRSLWDEKEFVNERGTESLKELFGNTSASIYFSYPKSPHLLKRIIQLATLPDSNDIILDFFSGSGTTAHATMQLNAEDNGNRKFILVQLNEPINQNNKTQSVTHKTIDEIAKERIKLAAKKIKSEKKSTLPEHFDGGFKHYRLISPNVKTLDKIIKFDPKSNILFGTNIIEQFSYKKSKTKGQDTLFTTWLIDDGYSFDTNIDDKVFGDYTARYVADARTLYLINPNWNTKALTELLDQISKNELAVNTIIVYAYSFDFESIRELKTNIKSNLRNKPDVIERY